MPIEVQCPACGKRLHAPDSQAGRAGKCPSCKADLSIPAAASVAGRPPPVPTVNPSARRAASPIPAVPDGALDGQLATSAGRSPAVVEETVVESKHWFALQIALKVTEMALLVEWISCALVAFSWIAIMLTGQGDRIEITLIQIVSVAMLWGTMGTLLGWTALVVGWIICRAVWPTPDRWLLQTAILVVGLAMLAVPLVFSLRIFGIPPLNRSSALYVASTPTAMLVIVFAAAGISLTLFNFFLASVQRKLGREQIRWQPIIYAVVIGTLTIWCLLINVFMEPDTMLKVRILQLSNAITLVAEFFWLWLLERVCLARYAREQGLASHLIGLAARGSTAEPASESPSDTSSDCP